MTIDSALLDSLTVLPIHRHRRTTETVVVLRGCLEEIFYEPTVILECKDGAYEPLGEEDILEVEWKWGGSFVTCGGN